jgi:hypothetical protein
MLLKNTTRIFTTNQSRVKPLENLELIIFLSIQQKISLTKMSHGSTMLRSIMSHNPMAAIKVIKPRMKVSIVCQLNKTYFSTAVKGPAIVVNKSVEKSVPADDKILKENCGTTTPDDELEEPEEMFIMGPSGIEWNGPTRGGAKPEPTKFGDWSCQKGRCWDF